MTTHINHYISNTEATRLTPIGLHSGMDITVQNLSDTDYVYIGGEGVNQEDFGYRLAPGNAWSVELSGRDALYAIADEPTYVAVLKTSLESGN
jgi:hypothetical protein